jgi:hypothetical protein
MRFSVRGGRKMIISEVDTPAPHPRIDNALLKALARAHRWRCQIENGEYATITELANANQVNQSYACRLLRLTLLAPSIVTDILDGQSNSKLSLKDLTRPFAVEWSEQLSGLNVRLSGRDHKP